MKIHGNLTEINGKTGENGWIPCILSRKRLDFRSILEAAEHPLALRRGLGWSGLA